MKRVLIILISVLLNTGLLYSLTGFAISPTFSIGDETLPVTLSSFMAIPNISNQTVDINWTSESEQNMIGYHIHRAEVADLSLANIISSTIIPAYNTSLTHNYSHIDNEVELDTNYYYWLQSIEYNGTNFHGPVNVRIDGEGDVPSLPNSTELVSIYPNPFNGNNSTNICVRVKENEVSDLSIYNLKGQLVRKDKILAGNHTIKWNGLDNYGKACSNGIYFIKMKSATYSKTSKVLLLK